MPNPIDDLNDLIGPIESLPKLHPACDELQPARPHREYTGDFNDATNVLLAGISWNIATLAREVKRIADALEQRDG